MGNRKITGINIGGVSIVMIISVLCLTIFSVLTLITSHNEKKLSQKAATAALNYYSADFICTRTLARIKELAGAEIDNPGQLATTLPGDITYEKIDDAFYISYGAPVDERQLLSVCVLVEGGSAKVLEWALTNAAEWSPSSALDYWIGD